MDKGSEEYGILETIEVSHGSNYGFLLFVLLVLMIGLGLGFVFAEVHINNHTMLGNSILQAPIVTDWFPEDVFGVVDSVKKAEGLDLGWVVVERLKDEEKFSAMVIPFREIPVGSTVEIFILEYPHHPLMQKDFLVVAPPDPD